MISIAFDYDNYDSYPQARMCVFMETPSDTRKADYITVNSENSDLIWKIDDIIKIKNDNYYLAGNTNLTLPDNKQFDNGNYLISYAQKDNKTVEAYLDVNYDKSFYQKKALEAQKTMIENGAKNNIILYDENNIVIYFGNKSDDFQTENQILMIYPKTSVYNEVYISNDNSIICNLPKKYIKTED